MQELTEDHQKRSNRELKQVNKPSVLLISGYDAASHQHWRMSLVNGLSEFHFTQVALAARHFSWRVRGSVLNLLTEHHKTLSQDYDLLIVTSMVDLA